MESEKDEAICILKNLFGGLHHHIELKYSVKYRSVDIGDGDDTDRASDVEDGAHWWCLSS